MYKKDKPRAMFLFFILIISIIFFNLSSIEADVITRPDGWSEETHGKSVDGNYSLIFSDDTVHRIYITISPENYKIMEDNLDTLNMMSTENPIYVPATVKFNNITWWHVGIRYKGQSTLFPPKQAGKHKYPFRLHFDKFEDSYPEIDDQRFYGFKKLIFSNNWYDPSYIRDKICSDIFREGGIPTPRSSFYQVYIDTGNGPIYWGLYTMFEDPSDEMLKSQFLNPDGNLYKGQQGIGADLTTFNQQGFDKKTNEKADDWSDIKALVTALNAPRSDAASWRGKLESVFDVNNFLKWLAINTSIVNFDNYGWVTKNYYLYQDLSNNGRLIFLPWDFNLSLSTTNPWNINIPIPSLSLNEIGSDWPLIRFLLDDPVYQNIYHQEMQSAINGCFNETTITAKMHQFHELIRPYVVGSESEINNYTYLTNGTTEFDQALTDLLNHVSSRQTAVRDYLSSISTSP